MLVRRRLGAMLYKRPSASGQRGDTIVEVLIAITIVSLILGGAYVTTNHSLLDTRDAQERSAAVKLVETQIEQLRNLAATNSNALFGGGVPASFCVTGSQTVVASTTSACKVDAGGAPTTAQPAYSLAVTDATVTSGGQKYTTFTVNANWDSLVGTNKDNVQMTYRLDK